MHARSGRKRRGTACLLGNDERARQFVVRAGAFLGHPGRRVDMPSIGKHQGPKSTLPVFWITAVRDGHHVGTHCPSGALAVAQSLSSHQMANLGTWWSPRWLFLHVPHSCKANAADKFASSCPRSTPSNVLIPTISLTPNAQKRLFCK